MSGPTQRTSLRGRWSMWDFSPALPSRRGGTESSFCSYLSSLTAAGAGSAASGRGGRCLPGARHRTPGEADPAFSWLQDAVRGAVQYGAHWGAGWNAGCSTGRIGLRGGMRGAIRGSLWCAVRGAGCIGVSSVVRYSAGGGSLAGGAQCGVRCGMGWSPGPGSTRWQDAEGLRAAVPEPERI